MIIDDDKVSAALDYLNEHPHPAARARKELRMAEIGKDKLFAELFRGAANLGGSTIKEREAAAQVNPLYIAACKTVADCEEAVEQHRARSRAAEMIIEIWRTESANARTAERIR